MTVRNRIYKIRIVRVKKIIPESGRFLTTWGAHTCVSCWPGQYTTFSLCRLWAEASAGQELQRRTGPWHEFRKWEQGKAVGSPKWIAEIRRLLSCGEKPAAWSARTHAEWLSSLTDSRNSSSLPRICSFFPIYEKKQKKNTRLRNFRFWTLNFPPPFRCQAERNWKPNSKWLF